MPRRFAIEIHSALAKQSKLRRPLRQALDRNIGQIKESIVRAQQADELEPADSELRACAVMAFVMSLMRTEMLLPHLIGDPKWRELVEKRARTFWECATESGLHKRSNLMPLRQKALRTETSARGGHVHVDGMAAFHSPSKTTRG
jgi:hypothetical protein